MASRSFERDLERQLATALTSVLRVSATAFTEEESQSEPDPTNER